MPHLAFDPVPRSAARQQRLDRAWLRQGGARLRFYRVRPAVSLGRHQVAAREARLAYCARHAIAVTRRESGGGALYLDPGQLCFSLLLPDTATLLGILLETGARAVAEALTALGARAAFKFPNDVEIAGGKAASLFAARAGHAVLLHGVVLLEADVRTMLEALHAPTEKLSADGLAAARDRLAPLSACLDPPPAPQTLVRAIARHLTAAFGLEALNEPAAAPAGAAPAAPAQPAGGLDALVKTAGGTLYCRLAVAGENVRAMAFSGDFHLAQHDALDRLADRLRGQPLSTLAHATRRRLAQTRLDMPGFTRDDVLAAVTLAAAKHAAARALELPARNAARLMPFAGEHRLPPLAVLRKASALLLPYCAKPAACAYRTREDCAECGACAVGEAYRLGRERGLEVTTIVNYEHLESTLARLREAGAEAYIGLCCGQFFRKRYRAFQNAGLPALLLDIEGATCYALKREHEAYAGHFQAEARLDLDTLRRVLRHVPNAAAAADEAAFP